jgi:hypothetical protein
LLIIVPFAVLTAQDKDYDISRKITGNNQNETIAINTSTGDVLVVWQRLEVIKGEVMTEGIYAAIALKKAGDAYKIKKARPVWRYKDRESSQDIDYGHPCVVYNPDEDSYLVVYSSGTSLTAFAQEITRKGKIKSDRVKVMDGTDPNSEEALDISQLKIFLAADLGLSGPKNAVYVAFFVHMYENAEDVQDINKKRGLHSAWLDKDGVMISDPQPMFPAVGLGGGEFVQYSVNSAVSVPDDKIMIGYTKPKSVKDGYYNSVFLGILDKNLKSGKSKRVARKNAGGPNDIIMIQEDLFLLTWMSDSDKILKDESDYLISFYSGALKKKAKPESALFSFPVFSITTVNLCNTPGAYQISSPHNNLAIYGRFIQGSGKLDVPRILFNTDANKVTVKAVCIPGTNKLFLVRKETSNDLDDPDIDWKIIGRVVDTGR